MTLAAVFLCGCTVPFGESSEEATEEGTESDDSLRVSVAVPETRDLAISSNFSGTVVAESEVNVIPLASGEVVEKNFDVGDHVNAGELLFKIDDEPYQIALKQAEAQVTINQASLTSAKANLNSAEANANQTRSSAVETVGKIQYNATKEDYDVQNSYVSKRKANNTLKDAEDNVDLYKDALDAAKSARDTAKSDYEELKKSGASAEEIAIAKALLDEREATVDKAEVTLDSAKRTADNAEMSLELSKGDYALSELHRYNYNTYTVPTTLYGAYASAVGADTSVTNSKANVTSTAAGVKSAEAGLENAQLNLEHTNVTAPVSGIITAINVTLHNMASTQSSAYTIQSDEQNKIVFYVAEETARNLIPGTDAVVTKNGTDYPGRIINVYDTVDSGTGLFKVEVSVSDPAAAGNLVTGLSVSIRTITRRSDRALTVPINAVYYDGEQAFIYVNDKGFAKRLNVTTGLSDDESVEITEGLTPDDQVIVTWSGSLRDGSKLKIDNASGGTAEAAPVSAQQPAGGAMVAAEPVTGDSDDVMVAVGAGER